MRQPGIEPATFRTEIRLLTIELRWHEHVNKYLQNIPMQFWPFYYQWKWMKSKEYDQTRVPKSLPAEIKRWRLQGWFSNISVQLNFTGTKTQFAEIFHTDIHEAQIFKIRGFRSTLKVGLGIFDFCTHSRRLISKDSISSPNFSCGCSYAERALWCRDSKRRALGNYFPVRIYYEFLISKCRGDWDLGLCTFWVLAFINPLSDGKIWFFFSGETRFFSEVAFTQRFSVCKYPKKAQT